MAIAPRDVRSVIVRAFTENLGIKTVALIITVVLFVLVRFQEKVDRWIDVEVAVMRPSAKSGLVVTSDMPDKVRVSLRGRSSVIKAVKSGDTGQVVVDLSGRETEGTSTFYFEPEMFDFPSGVEILHINPESVQVRIERIVTRRVPVNVRTVGKPKPGLELEGTPIAVPPEATISGPSSVVNGVAALDTEDVDVSALDVGEHELHVSLKRVGGVLVKYVDRLTVVAEVRYTPGQRVLTALPVRARVGERLIPEGAETRPAAVTAILSGPKIALDALDTAAVMTIAAVEDVAAIRGGSVIAPVQLNGLPPGVEVKAIEPATVKVRLSAAALSAAQAKGPPTAKGAAGAN
jgi:YbbR domain-containing protein